MTAVILVGGEGTRLRPLTLHCPKNVVPVVGRPFLHLPLELLKKHGIRDVVLCIGYLPERIREAVGDGRKLGMRVRYAIERIPLGTGGAIRNARKYLDGAAVVVNGDVLTDLDLTAVLKQHKARGAKATVVLTQVEDPSAYGLVEIAPDDRVLRFLEKPSPDELKDLALNTVNAGTYVLDPAVIEMIPPGVNYSLERGLFPSLLQQNVPFYAHVSSAYWLDIGTPEKYRQAHIDILYGKTRFEPALRHQGNVWLGKRTRVATTAVLEGPLALGDGAVVGEFAGIGALTVVGAGCRVGARAHIEGSVLWENCEIGEAARVTDAVLGTGCRIGDHAVIAAGTILGDHAIVPRFSRL